MSDKNKPEENTANCCDVHPMYETVLCENIKHHEGLHKGFYQGEFLRWGIPTYQERYDIVRTK